MENNEFMIDLAARLTLHEFLLEQIMANGALMAINPEQNWSDFSKGLIERIEFRSIASPDDAHAKQKIARASELAQNFCSKVQDRIRQATK